MDEYVKRCKCGAKLGFEIPWMGAPDSLRKLGKIPTCEPPTKMQGGIPMPQMPCPECNIWIEQSLKNIQSEKKVKK